MKILVLGVSGMLGNAMLRTLAQADGLKVVGTARSAAVLRQFGASYRKGPLQPDGSYAIDHTTATYVVDAEGKLVSTLNFGSAPEQVVAVVRRYL